MKKDKILDILGDLGSIMPPKIEHKPKTENINRKQWSEAVKAPPLGALLEKHEYPTGLICGLEIRAWGAEFDFYDGFVWYAVNFFNENVEEAEYIPFFSFTPQYTQLNQRQMKYYLYWRYKFRNGQCIKTDFSYIMLFVYEVLNLPEEVLSPKLGIKYLCYLWARYRKQYSQLDKYFSEWIPDYCLIHGVDYPVDTIKSFLPEILKITTFPEFYLNKYDIKNAEAELMRTSSEYDFNNASCVNEENREIFRRHINMALKKCFSNREFGEPPVVSVIRDSYMGALCPYENKRRMTVSYYKLERAEIDTVDATEAVKYAESLVKSGLGLRSKYIKTNLAPEIKDRIDEYFMGEINGFKNPTSKLREVGEKRYEPATKGFSEEEAKKIELESRATAELIEGESAEDNKEMKQAAEKPKAQKKKEKASEKKAKEEDENRLKVPDSVRFPLGFIFEEDYLKFSTYCTIKRLMPEAVIEEINYFAFTTIGDIVLESDGENYKVIEEYAQEVSQWLKK
ncbi:MAG: hypothetical protein E7675_01040 [Ruminococcaceae bacterium]|nr:hypothetical protein [Oscillospiraceae bacterium]